MRLGFIELLHDAKKGIIASLDPRLQQRLLGKRQDMPASLRVLSDAHVHDAFDEAFLYFAGQYFPGVRFNRETFRGLLNDFTHSLTQAQTNLPGAISAPESALARQGIEDVIENIFKREFERNLGPLPESEHILAEELGDKPRLQQVRQEILSAFSPDIQEIVRRDRGIREQWDTIFLYSAEPYIRNFCDPQESYRDIALDYRVSQWLKAISASLPPEKREASGISDETQKQVKQLLSDTFQNRYPRTSFGPGSGSLPSNIIEVRKERPTIGEATERFKGRSGDQSNSRG